MEQKRIYLWCLPRSLTTAFSRAMATVPKSKVITHPYMVPFFKENYPSQPPLEVDYGETFEEVRDNLNQAFTGYDLVFIKEGSSMIADRVEEQSYIPDNCRHTFIIRHPAKTLNSFITMVTEGVTKQEPDEKKREQQIDEIISENIEKEQSLKSLVTVFNTATQHLGQKPVVVEADDLQRNPEGTFKAYCQAVGLEYSDSMINWGPVKDTSKVTYGTQMSSVTTAYAIEKAFNSTKFLRSDPKPGNVEDLPEKYRGLARENIPLYEKLREHKLQPLD